MEESNKEVFLLFFFLLIPSITYCIHIPQHCKETQLLQHLLAHKNPSARPVLNKSDTVHVKFGLEVVHIESISESSQTIRLKVWLRIEWVNELMKWTPGDWDNLTRTRAFPETIWTPDFFLVEDISRDISAGPRTYRTQVVMNSNGVHDWYIPTVLDGSCHFHVANFPFDNQICAFKFMSWTSDNTELDIIPDDTPIVTNYYVNSTEWDLHHVFRETASHKYNCCPNPYASIIFSLEMRRKPLYYVYYVIVPCFMQMMIIMSTFFLPPESGERIGVAISIFLIFAVYLEVLRASLPKTSLIAPALAQFYLFAMMGSAFSLCASCFVLVIHFKGSEKGAEPLPYWVRTVLLKFVGKPLGIHPKARHSIKGNLLTDPLFSTLKKQRRKKMKSPWVPSKKLTPKIGLADLLCFEGVRKNDFIPQENDLSKILKKVSVIADAVDKRELEDEIEEEWRSLGKVFDRIFCLIFFIYFFTTTTVVLLPIYYQHYNSHAHAHI